MAKLLRRYNDVSHHVDHDVGLNRAVRQDVSLVAEAVPIWQPLEEVGAEEEGQRSSVERV